MITLANERSKNKFKAPIKTLQAKLNCCNGLKTYLITIKYLHLICIIVIDKRTKMLRINQTTRLKWQSQLGWQHPLYCFCREFAGPRQEWLVPIDSTVNGLSLPFCLWKDVSVISWSLFNCSPDKGNNRGTGGPEDWASLHRTCRWPMRTVPVQRTSMTEKDGVSLRETSGDFGLW